MEKIEFEKINVNTTDVKKFGIFGQNLETTKLRGEKKCTHTLLLVLIFAIKIMLYLTSLWFHKGLSYEKKINSIGLGISIVKNNLTIKFVESSWLKHFSMHLCFCVVFLLQKLFSQGVLPNLVERTKQLCPPNFSIMLLYHYKFRFIDVKGNS